MRSEFNYIPKKDIDGSGSIRFGTSTPLLLEGPADYVASFLEHAAKKYFTFSLYHMTAPTRAGPADRFPQQVLHWEWFREKESQERETLATLELRWSKRSTKAGFSYFIEFYMEGTGVTGDIRDYLSEQAKEFDRELAAISGRKEVPPSKEASLTPSSLDVLLEGEPPIEVGDGEGEEK